MKIRRIVGLCMLLVCMQLAQAQERVLVRDFETWNAIRLKKDFGKLDIGAQIQGRFNNNSTETDMYFMQFTASYKLVKPIKIGFGYRYIQDNEKEGFVAGNRFHFDLEASQKVGNFDFGARVRYQIKNESDELEDVRKLRFKAGFEYNISNWKLDPIFSAEFFRLQDGVASTGQKMRYTLGTKYKINKANSIGSFYRIEQELKEAYPATFHILGLNYTFKF